MTPPPTIGNSKDGIPTADLSHSGTQTTPLVGAVATAVYTKRVTLRPTTLRLNAAASPTLVRAQVTATLKRASPLLLPFLSLLPFLVCRRLALGIPTTTPVGRVVSVSIPYPYHPTAVGLCTQHSLNAASKLTLVRRTTSASQTW